MNKLSENYTHKWDPAGSFYLFITQRFISRPLVPFLIKLGIKKETLSWIAGLGPTVEKEHEIVDASRETFNN